MLLRRVCARARLSYVRVLSTSAQQTAAETTAKLQRWNLRLAHDNTFLSYHRNAIIATVAGSALVQYRREQSRPPLAAAGLLMMGGLYMYVGSLLYVWQVIKLRRELRLSSVATLWSIFNAAWPLSLWSVSLACLLDETPSWLLSTLSYVENELPTIVHSSLFLRTVSLQPVIRLLNTVQQAESRRLLQYPTRAEQKRSVSGLITPSPRDGHGGSVGRSKMRLQHHLTNADCKPARTIEPAPLRPNPGGGRGPAPPLTVDAHRVRTWADRDIITARLERLAALESRLKKAMKEHPTVVPTPHVLPLIEKLHKASQQLEIALEAELRPLGERSKLRRLLSPGQDHQRAFEQLTAELDAVRALNRRCIAVTADSDSID